VITGARVSLHFQSSPTPGPLYKERVAHRAPCPTDHHVSWILFQTKINHSINIESPGECCTIGICDASANCSSSTNPFMKPLFPETLCRGEHSFDSRSKSAVSEAPVDRAARRWKALPLNRRDMLRETGN
jgi:hypothetical protein